MGESKYTPQLRAGEIRHAGRTRLVEYADGRRGFAAEVQAGYIGNEVDEANRDALTYLFAAAPEVLGVLERNAAETHAAYHEGHAETCLRETCKRARAIAIKATTGGETVPTICHAPYSGPYRVEWCGLPHGHYPATPHGPRTTGAET